MIDCGRILPAALSFGLFEAATRGQGAGPAKKDVKGEEVAILQAGTWD